MTIPSIAFGFLIATVYGVIFHLIRGGGFGKLILYILLAWIGFWIGQILANQLDLTFLRLGSLNLGMATIFSFMTILIGYWLSLVDLRKK
jgi:hypothetical protein